MVATRVRHEQSCTGKYTHRCTQIFTHAGRMAMLTDSNVIYVLMVLTLTLSNVIYVLTSLSFSPTVARK